MLLLTSLSNANIDNTRDAEYLNLNTELKKYKLHGKNVFNLIENTNGEFTEFLKFLKEYNLKDISEEQLQTFVGEGMLSLAKKVVDFCGGDRELYQIVYQSYRKNYSDEPFKYSSLMPGAMSALNFFYWYKFP